MSFSRSDVSAKKHMARVSDLYGERFRSIKTVLFFIVSVSLLFGEAVPTTLRLEIMLRDFAEKKETYFDLKKKNFSKSKKSHFFERG